MIFFLTIQGKAKSEGDGRKPYLWKPRLHADKYAVSWTPYLKKSVSVFAATLILLYILSP